MKLNHVYGSEASVRLGPAVGSSEAHSVLTEPLHTHTRTQTRTHTRTPAADRDSRWL